MKNIFLLTALLFSITVFGQTTTIKPLINLKKGSNSTYTNIDHNQVYKWEAYTSHGAIIFGVSKTKSDAEWVISDFTERNKKNAYKPIDHIIKPVKATSIDFIASFKKKYPKGYKVLGHQDLTALRMIKVSSINSAASFIENVTDKNNSEAFEYVFKLNNNFKTYSIEYFNVSFSIPFLLKNPVFSSIN